MKKVNNIVLIDDDEISIFLNKTIVETLDVAENVLCMADEQQALEYILEKCAKDSSQTEDCPDLIFLDLNMPLLNAFEFLELLKQHPGIAIEKLYFVLLTSSWDSRDVEKAKTFGINSFLHKPLTNDKVEQVLQHFHQQQVSIRLKASIDKNGNDLKQPPLGETDA